MGGAAGTLQHLQMHPAGREAPAQATCRMARAWCRQHRYACKLGRCWC